MPNLLIRRTYLDFFYCDCGISIIDRIFALWETNSLWRWKRLDIRIWFEQQVMIFVCAWRQFLFSGLILHLKTNRGCVEKIAWRSEGIFAAFRMLYGFWWKSFNLDNGTVAAYNANEFKSCSRVCDNKIVYFTCILVWIKWRRLWSDLWFLLSWRHNLHGMPRSEHTEISSSKFLA